MQLGTYSIGHIALRVSDLAQAKRFYVETLGFNLLMDGGMVVTIAVHGLPIALIGQQEKTGASGRFDPFHVGLDHIALGVTDVAELQALQHQLDAANVTNHGIEQDAFTGATYISFYDPDGIAWELYVLTSRS